MIIKNVQKKENRKKSNERTGGEVKSAFHGTCTLIQDEESVERDEDDEVPSLIT